MAEKLKALCKDGLNFLMQKINEDFVTKEEFNYKPISINSFTNNKNTVELGTIITDVTLNWSLTKDPQSLTINDESITPANVRTKTYSGLNLTANKTYTLKVTDEKEASATKTTSITFVNGVYWGVSSEPGPHDSAFVLSLTKGLQANKNKTFTVNAGEGEYIYYILPTRYGTPTFNIGGFDGGFIKVDTIQFTNSSGYTEAYSIFRSANPNLGNTTVTVK